MDTSRNNQAIEIIAKEISKLPAETIMDHGTLGHTMGHTKRESEAHDMAKYFVTKIMQLDLGELSLDPGKTFAYLTDEQKVARELIDQIAAAAVEKAGK